MKKTNLLIVLTAGYLLCQIVADITASKMVDLFGLYVPAAVFIYAFTFTLRDLIHSQFGKQTAVFIVITAAIVNVLMAIYFVFTTSLKPAPFWQGQQAFQTVLGVVPRITVASIVAEVVSELIDTQGYHLLEKKPRWVRVVGSNSVSLPVDTVVFISLAFAGSMPLTALISIGVGQLITKSVVTLFSIPMIYALPKKPLYEPELIER